ncbi:MAG: hypothetical protein ACYTG1_09185 [Planctomycetota bacterium]|jgi:hypothetical protein
MTPEQPQRSVVVPRGMVLPPPPPGVRHVRVYRVGTVVADDDLRIRIDRFFHWPMIVLALLILPLLALEFWHPPPRLSFFWWVSTGGLAVIWLAFLVEFVIKIAIAECRLEYVKRNWLDVVILLLPALRPLRAGYIVRTSRVFTLRGVGMKFARYFFTFLIGMEASERLMERFGIRHSEGRKDPRQMTRHQLVDEVKALRRLNDEWEAWHEAHERHVERHGRCTPMPAPSLETEPPREAEPEPEPEPVAPPEPRPDAAPADVSPSAG